MSNIIQFPGNRAKRGYPPPKRKWDAACKWCKGSGFVPGLREPEPCQGCAGVRKPEPESDTWAGLIRDMIADFLGPDAWAVLKRDRTAQVRAYMIADRIMRCMDPLPDKADRFRIMAEAIPLSVAEARNLALAILSEHREAI